MQRGRPRIDMNSVAPKQSDQLERLITAVERLERKLDEFCGAFLNARFPFGRPTDRWRRGA
jgi:hypothetical protein